MPNFDLQALSDEEFRTLRRAVLEEKRRRDSAPAVEEALDAAAQEYHAANPPATTDDGTPVWCQPLGAFDAWPVGAVVAHQGRRWRNILPKVNVWEPGADGPVPTWEDITPPPPDDPEDSGQTPPIDSEPEVPAWAPGVPYTAGHLATHDAATYRCVQAHTSQTGWEPPAVPALWQPA